MPFLTCSSPAAATVEIKKMGVDKWNDTYYPTAADASNVTKQWCVRWSRACPALPALLSAAL